MKDKTQLQKIHQLLDKLDNQTDWIMKSNLEILKYSPNDRKRDS